MVLCLVISLVGIVTEHGCVCSLCVCSWLLSVGAAFGGGLLDVASIAVMFCLYGCFGVLVWICLVVVLQLLLIFGWC